MSNDVLKRPVHLAILKPTHIQNLASAGHIVATPFGMDPQTAAPPLPEPVVEKVSALGLPKALKQEIPSASSMLKKNKQHFKLRVIFDSTPPIPKEKTPPCSSCATAACCHAFVVNISQMEYESGLYGDAAIKLTPDIYNQLKSRFLAVQNLGTPVNSSHKDTYFLDGKIGEPCPFLTEKKQCGIYDIRPVTCRTYTCVGDPRITEEMRAGTQAMDIFSLSMKKLKDAE